jgi:hypothetical protein
MPAQKVQQLAALRMREDSILSAPVGASQKLVHDEGDRHLQLAEQLVRKTGDALPVDGPVALFFREDLTEPQFELVDLHAGILAATAVARPKPRLAWADLRHWKVSADCETSP